MKGHMPRRGLALAVPVAIALSGIVVAAVLLLRDEGGDASATQAPVRAELDRCGAEFGDEAKRACYGATLERLVVAPASDPRGIVNRISNVAWSDRGGFLLPNCHGLMHSVGREYATAHGVRLETLMNYLPRSNDPGCSAGFAHGLVSAVAPQIDPGQPRAATAVCDRAATRYQRYSCIHGFGHAFMRVYNEQLAPALELCQALGGEASDCAQGAFHDYWFSVTRADGTAPFDAQPELDPRILCAKQARDLVRPCWYRAFIDTRPRGFETRSPADVESLCGGLESLQRDACVTAASVIGPHDPVEQLALCGELRAADTVSCVHGTKVQNLLGSPIPVFLGVIRACGRLAAATRNACYFWLGKTLSVVTDGRFARQGCPTLPAAARRECLRGAASTDGPLVTFS